MQRCFQLVLPHATGMMPVNIFRWTASIGRVGRAPIEDEKRQAVEEWREM